MKMENITICACRSRSFMVASDTADIVAALRNDGHNVAIVDDLCRLVADEPEEVKQLAQGTIIACHQRVVQSHMDLLGIKPGTIIEARKKDTKEVLASFNISDNSTEHRPEDILKEIEALPVYDSKDAWYPVIDKSKCTECAKCFDFCLFGVYTVENKKVKVTQPNNCKNNCPACARMCPGKAIVFPKYDKSPINGGTEIEEVFTEDDMEEMYQKRLQYRLQQNRSRFSMLKKDK